MDKKSIVQRFRDWQKDPYPLQEPVTHTCVGCGKTYEGEYCPICGQRQDEGPVDWLALKQDLISVGGIEEPESPTSFITQLFGRTGYLIEDYIKGRRYVCASPVAMLGVFAAATVIISHFFPTPPSELAQTLAGAEGFIGKIFSWLAENINWAVLIQTALLVLPTMLLFRHSPKMDRHTLPQGLYIQAFMASLVLFCIILRTIVSDWVLVLIPIFYYVAYKQLFGYDVWGTLWRTLLCMGVIMYFYGLVMMAVLQKEYFNEMPIWVFLGVFAACIAFGAALLVLGWMTGRRTEERRRKRRSKA